METKLILLILVFFATDACKILPSNRKLVHDDCIGGKWSMNTICRAIGFPSDISFYQGGRGGYGNSSQMHFRWKCLSDSTFEIIHLDSSTSILHDGIYEFKPSPGYPYSRYKCIKLKHGANCISYFVKYPE